MRDDLRLRPLAEDDLPLLLAMWNDPAIAGPFGFGTLRSAQEQRGSFDEDGFLPRDGRSGRLAVVDDRGTFLGSVSWLSIDSGPPPWSTSFMLGVAILPEHRGRGVGTAAQRLLAHHLLQTTAVNRVEAATDVENVAEQRALEKAGFVREGVLRGAQWRAGAYHDLVLYSFLRSDLGHAAG